MCKRKCFSCNLQALIVFLITFCIFSFASVTINGIVFDSAVVNDNAGQATPVNFSCTQAGGTVTLSGQQPRNTANVTYFYNHYSQGEEWKFMSGFNFTNLTDTNSLMGIMFYSGALVGGASDMAWCRLGITGKRRVYLESHNICDPPRKDLLCTLKTGVTKAYIMAKIESGMLSFFVSDSPLVTGNESAVLQLGSPFYFPYGHAYGFFLEPHVTGGFERAVFNSISIIPRDSTNGITAINNYSISGISGLTDWASMTLPANFFNTPMKLIQDIRSKYRPTDSFADPNQRRLFRNMTNMKNNFPLKSINGNEKECIDISIYNAQIYLADILDSLITGNPRKYPSGSTTYQLMFGFSLNGLLQQGIDLVNACAAISETHWYDFLNPVEPFIYLYHIADCASDIEGALVSMDSSVINHKDDIIMDGAQYIENLTLMALLDRNFYNNYFVCFNSYFEQVRAFIKKAAPVYGNNNIPMKVYSALALWDLAHKVATSSATLNLMLQKKFMDGGAYAEGSHYLDWLNKELLPYYFISAYNGWLPAKLQLNSMKNSGYWLLNMADKSGIIAPIDDGVNDEITWLAPYAYFNNDNAFKEYDSSNFFYNEPIKFLTYPPLDYPGHLTINPIGVYEGIGKINYNSITDSAYISVTLPTETSGPIKVEGKSHDQQDDGSISLRRVRKGMVDTNDDLIYDPGYAGYLHKSKEEYFNYHNTVQINPLTHGGINCCPVGTLDTCMKMASQALGIDITGAGDGVVGALALLAFSFPLTNAIAPMLTPVMYYYYGDIKNEKDSMNRIDAGGPGYSDMVKLFSNGFQAKITYDTKTDYAFRTVLHVDDEVFVIDQISSNYGDYSVHYNLPEHSLKINNHIFVGYKNHSSIRITGFCSDSLKTTFFAKDSFEINAITDHRLQVYSVRFSNAGINLPGLGTYCSFLTTLEPADSTFTYGSAYTPVTGDVGTAQICVSRQIGTNLIRYVFVNTVTNGVRGTVRIPALTGWNTELTTDAEYGIVEFDRTKPGILNQSNLYLGTTATYGGQNINLDTITVGSLVLNKVVESNGTISSESISQVNDTVTLQATHSFYNFGEGFLFAHPLTTVQGDFSATVRILPTGTNKTGSVGLMFFPGTNMGPGKNYFQMNMYNDWGGTEFNFHPSNSYVSSKTIFPYKFWLKLEKIGNHLNGYYSQDGVNFTSQFSYGYVPPIDSSSGIILPQGNEYGYVGLCYNMYWDTAVAVQVKFSDFSIERPGARAVFKKDFAKNTTLSALGFISDTGRNNWISNSTQGFMYASTEGGAYTPAIITTPPISANRNLDSGVTIEFKAQFPAWYYNQNFGINNQLQVSLKTADGASGYSLLFMPTASSGQTNSFDFKLSKIGGTTLAQLNSGVITPIDSNGVWIKFRIDVLANPSSGGTGEIKVYYDAGDGLGFVREIDVVDTSVSNFGNITFSYTTGKSPDNYMVRIGDMNVGQLKSEAGFKDYRYRVTPILNSVVYKGNGIWNARFGYYNPNAVAIVKNIGPQNGFTYKGLVNQNYGQPTTFNPGTFNSVFNVDFDGSSLTWTLDSQSVTAVPAYLFKVEMKDNGISESNISKPQIRVTNTGSQAISGFKLRLWFSRAEYFSQQVVADKYYVNPSGITLSQGVHPGNPNIVYVEVDYPADFQLSPGAKTTDDGIQLGVHFNNYYPGQWTKSNDWSWQGITGAFSETRYVTVYDINGNLLYGYEPAASSTPQPPSLTIADIFGFEKLNGWIAPAGATSLNTTNKTQGTASLKISGGGYQTINSIDMPTANITGETSKLKVDIYIGPTQPNPYWIGALQLFASCPSAGLYNAYLGQCELNGKPYNAFSTLSFTITNDVLAVLRGTYTDFSFKWALNTNTNSGPYSLDNMRFTTP